MKPAKVLLAGLALTLVLSWAGAALADSYMVLSTGTEKWFSALNTRDDSEPLRMHTVMERYEGAIYKMHRETLLGRQVIAEEDRLFSRNTEGDILFHGILQDRVYSDPILWVDAPLEVGKTWFEHRPAVEGSTDPDNLIHFGFAVVDNKPVTCPLGTFDCFRVVLWTLYPDGQVDSCLFWYNDTCGLVRCCLEDDHDFSLVKVIPSDNSTDYDIEDPLPASELLGGLLGAPNPAKPSTSISFDLKSAAQVDVEVYDISGRLIKRLAQGEFMAAGPASILWQGVDEQGRPVASGTYLFRVKAGPEVSTSRVTLVR